MALSQLCNGSPEPSPQVPSRSLRACRKVPISLLPRLVSVEAGFCTTPIIAHSRSANARFHRESSKASGWGFCLPPCADSLKMQLLTKRKSLVLQGFCKPTAECLRGIRFGRQNPPPLAECGMEELRFSKSTIPKNALRTDLLVRPRYLASASVILFR